MDWVELGLVESNSELPVLYCKSLLANCTSVVMENSYITIMYCITVMITV